MRIEAERDQAGQRSDGRAQTTDVDTEQQRLPVLGKAAQQDGSRDVTDDLAGGQGCQQGRAADDVLQAGAHAAQRADVAREQEEAHEGQQQTVIDAVEDVAVDQEQRQADQSKQCKIGQDVKDGEQAQDEQHTEERHALAVGDLFGFGKADLQGAAFAAQRQSSDADQTDQCKGQNHAEELTSGQFIAGIEEQVLWVADRCDHTAEICRDRLQDDDRDEQRALSDQTEHQNGEGDEGDECDVVCDGH